MKANKLVVVTDRGGHLHDALRLIDQMAMVPEVLITTNGPDVAYLSKTKELKGCRIVCVPLFFSWIGKQRFFNPLKLVYQTALSFFLALRFRPKFVISTGASDVVPFCYFAWMLGAKIYHIENLAQVVNASVTGRMLYPICTQLFVQWEDLKSRFGAKAVYQGWVL